MKNLFENASFDDAYLTKNGKTAIYIYGESILGAMRHFLVIEGTKNMTMYDNFGKTMSVQPDIIKRIDK